MALCALTLLMRGWEASLLVLPAVHDTAPSTVALMLVAALALVAVSLWWAFEVALANDGRLFRWFRPHAGSGVEA
jgi:hypothetical protein